MTISVASPLEVRIKVSGELTVWCFASSQSQHATVGQQQIEGTLNVRVFRN